MDSARAALEEAARHEQSIANRRAWAASVAGMEAAHQDRQKPFVDAAARALDEVQRGREERARLTKSMSPGAVRAAARTRDAYLERDRHRVLFERPLGRSPTTSAVPERWHSSRDGRYWVAVPDAGGVTQARRLDQLPGRIAEVSA